MDKSSDILIVIAKLVELQLAINLSPKISKKQITEIQKMLLSLVEKLDAEIHDRK
ncbi:MAG: hypothetical protein WCK98_06385 [bacterium]